MSKKEIEEAITGSNGFDSDSITEIINSITEILKDEETARKAMEEK